MRVLPVLAFVAAALCACGGGAAPGSFDRAVPDRMLTSVARWAAPPHADLRKSWISPELARTKAAVLFVSDAGTADVYIYNLPALRVIGTITGFVQPQGECSDKKGDVWVTDTNPQTIYEVSHHGQLENVLSDSEGYPVACAWDPSTGNLAVMNLFGVSGSSGSVLLYVHGSGSPAEYTNSAQYYYNFGGYDNRGDLFFDGRDENGNFMLSELAKGAKSAQTIALTGGAIYFPGMVQWDSKKNLVVGDQSCGDEYVSCLYAVTVNSTNSGTIEGSTGLEGYSGGQVCDLVQGVEFNGQIAGSDNNFCGSARSASYLWIYPGGGAPTHYNNMAVTTPVGAALSR